MPEAVHVGSGKVRELYALDDDRLLLVASDRISTFDVVLPTEIPDKGRVLTGLSGFWFARTQEIVPNHLLALRDDGRSIECRRLEMLPIECVVRGYLTGSGWKDYKATGEVCGHRAARGARASRRELPRADLHTRDEGASTGHDENIDRDRAAEIVGAGAARRRRADLARALPLRRRSTPRTAGSSSPTRSSSSGSTPEGRLVLGDEALTPDSSRFWPADEYAPGRGAAVVRQAVRPRLLRVARVGQDRAGPGAAGGGRRRDAGALRRGVRAPDRDRVRRLPREPGGRALVRATVLVRPKPGILDPQGEAVRELAAAPRLPGRRARASAVSSTSSSRRPSRPRRARRSSGCAEQLLANPLIESFEIELEGPE